MRDFLHRLYPYQAFKLMLQRGKQLRQSTSRITEPINSCSLVKPNEAFDPIQGRSHLVALFRTLKQVPTTQPSSIAIKSGHLSHEQSIIVAQRRSILLNQLGFYLEIAPSKIPNAGLGVFLRGSKASTNLKPGTIVAMYPGTLFEPGEAIFFNSINNRYILKCNDGVYVDGKSKGLSGSIFRSVNGRDNYPGITSTTDISWMIDWSKLWSNASVIESSIGIETNIIKNPLAVGQIVNNGTSHYPSNVRYQELDIRTSDCPLELQEFLPNIWHSDDWHAHDHDEVEVDWSERSQSHLDHLRTVVLVTTRGIKEGEELYSTYIEQ